MRELVFHNRTNPPRLKIQTIRCSADSVEKIVEWYGGFHSGDNVTLHIDGVKAKLDHNLQLISALDPRTVAL